VEDDAHLLHGIREILTLEQYKVLIADNGQAALNCLEDESAPPDLIVSDIMMPVMNGFELLTAVRRDPRWLTLPFIFLTAKGEKADVQRGRRLGVDDYLHKPFDPDELLTTIESRLERHRALTAAHTQAMADLKRNILMILNHEFRTPLTLVVAYADMLNDQNAEQLNREELALFLRGVNSGAERLRRLVENFILLVELETGESNKVFQWRKGPIHDAQHLLLSAVNSVRRNPKVDNEFHFECDPTIPSFVADRDYLITALIQLLDNAIKFSDSKSPIHIGARCESETNKIIFWVRDEGRGIDAKNLDEIWKSFYQPDRGQFEDQGAGSGLAIVRGVVDLHSGRVDVESERGVGSTFRLTIPLVTPETAANEQMRAQA
jgi:two-component system, sensor histidine kinase and response regulator